MEAFDDRLANFRSPAAAIPKQENRDVAKLGEVGAIDDRTAAPLGGHEARARQDRQMGRKRVGRHFQLAREVACRKAIGLMFDQRPEGLQTGRLGQRREGENGFF
ncbi:hypothetical protein JOE50_004949 [Bradyrhizobium japonicum]|nr:hypothetical protein [Bradyrhizobium japonicum]